MPTLGSLCFSVFRLIQSSREGQGENINEQMNIIGHIYASMIGQTLQISISQDPYSTIEINKFRCTIFYIINK